MEVGNMKQTLSELKGMMNTPIKAYTPSCQTTSAPSPSVTEEPRPASVASSADSAPTPAESANTSTVGSSLGVVTPAGERATSPEGERAAEGDMPGQITRVLGKGTVIPGKIGRGCLIKIASVICSW